MVQVHVNYAIVSMLREARITLRGGATAKALSAVGAAATAFDAPTEVGVKAAAAPTAVGGAGVAAVALAIQDVGRQYWPFVLCSHIH